MASHYVTTVLLLILLWWCWLTNPTNTESIEITPETAGNLINITIDDDVVISEESWIINAPSASNDTQWAFQMEIISHNLQFYSSMESTITIAIYGSCITLECDLFFGFGTNNKYFTFAMDLDNTSILNGTDGIHIYPERDLLGNDDIRLIMDESDQFNALSGGNQTNWNILSTTKNGNNLPIIFEMKNNPLTNQVVFKFYSPTFTNGVGYSFNDSFQTQQPLYFMINPKANDIAINVTNLMISLYTEPLYILNRNQLNWEDSNSFCLFNYNSYLASVHDEAENVEAVKTFEVTGTWNGLTDSATEGVWQWIDETEVNYIKGMAWIAVLNLNFH